MTAPDNKRKHRRWLLEEDVFCYLDGARFDAMSRDISIGGIFMRTTKMVPIGSVIALVFVSQHQKGVDAIYLLGEVARREDGPPPGLAVEWLRAVTAGGDRTLVRFLHSRLGLAAKVDVQQFGPKGEIRHVYRFPRDYVHAPVRSEEDTDYELDVPSEETMELEDPDDAPVLPRFLSAPMSNKLSTVDGVKAAKTVDDVLSSRLDGRATTGPISELIGRQETVWPVDLPVKVKYNGRVQVGRLTGAGAQAVCVRVREAPTDPGHHVPMVIDLQSKKGKVQIKLECRIVNVDVKGPDNVELDLDIRHLEEGGHSGIFPAFIRWLAHRSMRK